MATRVILPLQARQPSCGDQEYASGNDAFLIFRIADKLGIVWDGIAMHASVVGHYKRSDWLEKEQGPTSSVQTIQR